MLIHEDEKIMEIAETAKDPAISVTTAIFHAHALILSLHASHIRSWLQAGQAAMAARKNLITAFGGARKKRELAVQENNK
jgi:hypothetical protein